MNAETTAPKKGFSDMIKSHRLVLVDFYADWCGPCKMMAPILTQLKKKLGDRLKILKVDVDRNPNAAANWQIQGVPTLMLFKEGKIVWRQAGAVPASFLEQLIETHNEI